MLLTYTFVTLKDMYLVMASFLRNIGYADQRSSGVCNWMRSIRLIIDRKITKMVSKFLKMIPMIPFLIPMIPFQKPLQERKNFLFL